MYILLHNYTLEIYNINLKDDIHWKKVKPTKKTTNIFNMPCDMNHF